MKKNNCFFQTTLLHNNPMKWADFYDWIFDENKFETWDRKKKYDYTNKIKKTKYLDNCLYETKPKSFPTRGKRCTVYMRVSEGGEGLNLVRHIRNGIAHGNARVRTINHQKYIEITDGYNHKQTAYILIPMVMLFELKYYSENV